MRVLVILICSFCIGFNSFSQETYIKEVVAFLADDALLGRATGTEQETIAANFIAEELKGIKGCKVVHQPFKFEVDSVKYLSQNVIGFINNHSDRTILISAHYDHLGIGGKQSKSHMDAVHNGADDNASGVALMLSLAKQFAIKKTKVNYLFIAYSGHELGLFGSKYFAENLDEKFGLIVLVVNFDMVGRLNNENKLYYDCTTEIEDSLINFSNNQLVLSKSVYDRLNVLDTKWLVANNIPSITFSTGRHIDYHKTTDDIQHINFEGMVLIERVILDWLKMNYLIVIDK